MKMYIEFLANSPLESSKLLPTIDCLIFKTSDGRKFRISDEDSIDSRSELLHGDKIEFCQRYKSIGISNADEDNYHFNVDFSNGKNLLSFMDDVDLELEEVWSYVDLTDIVDPDDDTEVFKIERLLDLTLVDYDANVGKEIYCTLSDEKIKNFNDKISEKWYSITRD